MNIKGRLKKLEEVLTVMDQDEKIFAFVEAIDKYITDGTDESEEQFRQVVRDMKRG